MEVWHSGPYRRICHPLKICHLLSFNVRLFRIGSPAVIPLFVSLLEAGLEPARGFLPIGLFVEYDKLHAGTPSGSGFRISDFSEVGVRGEVGWGPSSESADTLGQKDKVV